MAAGVRAHRSAGAVVTESVRDGVCPDDKLLEKCLAKSVANRPWQAALQLLVDRMAPICPIDGVAAQPKRYERIPLRQNGLTIGVAIAVNRLRACELWPPCLIWIDVRENRSVVPDAGASGSENRAPIGLVVNACIIDGPLWCERVIHFAATRGRNPQRGAKSHGARDRCSVKPSHGVRNIWRVAIWGDVPLR